MLMPHGWPGSVFELLKVVDPLTNPTAHGGRAEDAFHLVLPSLPGYGFSGKPQKGATWGPDQMGRAFHELMQRLGYKEYVAQGGDWGAIIAEVMAVQAPKGLLAIHVNMPGTVPPSVLDLIRLRQPAPATFSEKEKTAFAGLEYFYRNGFGYAEMMNTRPQTLGYSLADSPVGMLAFYYDKFAEWTHSNRQPEKVLSRDDILDQVTLYWLTNTGTSSSRSYWDAAQGGGGPFNAVNITEVPGRGDGLPRRDFSRSEELGRAGVQEADLLERGRQGRSLRRERAAADLRRGDAQGVQVAAIAVGRSVRRRATLTGSLNCGVINV